MISLKRQSINTTISERYATIIYSFDFENTRNLPNHSDELRFAITIDTDAFIAGFTADIDGELFIGRTEEKEEAKQEYTAAKEKNENAILISQPNKEIANVFEIKTNIDSGSKIALNITIEQYLKKRFNYNQLNIQLLNDYSGTTIRKGYSDIEYTFVIKDKRGISGLTIPLHNGAINHKRDKYVCKINDKITAQQLSLTNELVLRYKIDGESDESSLLFDEKTNTFCHVISDVITDAKPETNMTEGTELKNNESVLIPRRVCFVIDKSGSMSGNKWNYTVKATVMALKKLRNGIDRYRIILCGSQLDYSPKNITVLALVNKASIKASIKYLQAQTATGCEQLNQGLLEGIKAIKYDIIKSNNDKQCEFNFFVNQIIFISDGRPTIGETNVDKIITNVKNANDISKIDKYSNKVSVFAFGVGRDGNGSQWMSDLPHAFLKSLAVNNNGFYQRIKQKTADTELSEYINILSKPISTNIRVKYECEHSNINTNLTQTRFNSLYEGNDLVICGKFESNKNTIPKSLTATISAIRCQQVRGQNKPVTVNKTIKMNIDSHDSETENIERIWAYLSLQQYATKKLKYNDMIEMDECEQKEEDKIPLQLALKYQFVSPWTSMIVVKKKDNKQGTLTQAKNEQKSIDDTSVFDDMFLKEAVVDSHVAPPAFHSIKNDGFEGFTFAPKRKLKKKKPKRKKGVTRGITRHVSSGFSLNTNIEDQMDYASRIDQMQVIFDIIGSPNDTEIAKITGKNAQKYLRNLPQRKKKNLKRMFPGSKNNALDLLTQLLKFDVSERISVDGALEHSYLKAMQSDKDKKVKNIYVPRPGVSADTDSDELEMKDASAVPAWRKYFEKDELLGRYEFVRELGRGSIGIVFEGKVLKDRKKLQFGTKVAIKKIRRVFHTANDAKNLLKELRILRRFKIQKYDSILTLYDIIPPTEPKRFAFLTVVFEFVDADLLKLFRTNQFLTAMHVKYILYQILAGVKHMHCKKIVHCNLNPSNILINENCSIKITDFSLVCGNIIGGVTEDEKSKDETVKFQKNDCLRLLKRCRKWYVAPEVILLQQKQAIDIWSVGAIFAELLQMQRENRPDPTKRSPIFPGESACWGVDYSRESDIESDGLGQKKLRELILEEVIKYNKYDEDRLMKSGAMPNYKKYKEKMAKMTKTKQNQ